jgi:tetratricopeptide (TPR) repeat protein
MFYSKCIRHLAGALFIFLLVACATPPQSQQLKKAPPQNIQQKVVLEEAPFFPQQEYQCGPAALATVLVDQGIDVVPDDLINKVYIPERQGSLQIEMVATARSYGLLSYKINPTLGTILSEIDNGNLVLVFQNLGLQFWPKWHYAVAIGYDLNKAEILLRSGAFATHTISFSTFERTWARANYWAYVFMPPGKIPQSANPIQYIQSCHDLQKTRGNIALKAFQSGAERWPHESIVLMALGNAEFDAKNYSNAIAAYQQEIIHRPKNEMAWNNLSYALAANQCKQLAIAAVMCASQLSPDDKNIQLSLLEIEQFVSGNSGKCTEIICPVE